MYGNFLTSPDFLFGLVTGAALVTVLGLAGLTLLGFLDERAEQRAADRRSHDPADQVAHLRRAAADARFGGDLPAPPRVPAAANDPTLDFRDAYSRPRTARRDMRSGPR